jgi:hypothetical protein
MIRNVAIVAVLLGAVGLATPARADIVLGAGLSGSFGVGGDDIELPGSWSLSGLAGYQLDVGPLEITPELELIYLGSLESLSDDQVDWAFQALGGARAGLALGGWVPSVYLHFGLGNVRFAADDLEHEDTGPALEVGAALDYRLADLLSLGVQVGYNAVRLSDLDIADDVATIRWVRAGVYAKLVL